MIYGGEVEGSGQVDAGDGCRVAGERAAAALCVCSVSHILRVFSFFILSRGRAKG